MTDTPANRIVTEAANAARAAAASIGAASEEVVAAVIRTMADLLDQAKDKVLAANEADVAAATADGLSPAMIDRLQLDDERLAAMANQLVELAEVPPQPVERFIRDLPDGLGVWERHRPVGVIGANFEARPNVTIDVASQLVRSRNAGVLRTGSAALGTSIALIDTVVSPALAVHDIDPAAIQLVRTPDRAAAHALVAQPGLIPLVILRGSGESTRTLAAEAAQHGVRTLAHADGGGVLVAAPDAETDLLIDLIHAGLDRFGVCNRLNLLLLPNDTMLDVVRPVFDELGVTLSLPPHDHPLGHEWSLDDGREKTVTVSFVDNLAEAAQIASELTPGIAATIVTADPATAAAFIDAYTGTGVFWNSTTRLLDGYKLLGVPETGINVEHVPGPRGPVTFRDLVLRQFVVRPKN
jgi:glutamate-5-semialdehyde dehydrogenase